MKYIHIYEVTSIILPVERYVFLLNVKFQRLRLQSILYNYTPIHPSDSVSTLMCYMLALRQARHVDDPVSLAFNIEQSGNYCPKKRL